MKSDEALLQLCLKVLVVFLFVSLKKKQQKTHPFLNLYEMYSLLSTSLVLQCLSLI